MVSWLRFVHARRFTKWITPFIDLNDKGGRPPVYKNDFTIDKDGVPICPAGHRMHRDGIEVAKGRMKFKCPKMCRKTFLGIATVMSFSHTFFSLVSLF